MPYTLQELKTKSESDLVIIAEELGLNVNPEAQSKKAIIDDILKAQEEDAAAEEETSEAEEIKPIVVPKPVKVKADKKPTLYRLTISNQDGVDQTAFVKVQVNGYMYTIPREVEVEVPEEVIEVLKNAVVTRWVQEGGEWVPRKAKRFPFTVLGEVK